MGRKKNNQPIKRTKSKTEHPGLHKRKGPAGTGKARKSEVRKRRRNGKEMYDQLQELHKKRSIKMANLEPKEGEEKSPGFEKLIVNEMPVSRTFPRFFWKGDAPKEGEPEMALKLQRKELGLRVLGSPIPPPVSSFTDDSLPPAFKGFFNERKNNKASRLQKPTPIQAQVWPASLCGIDVVGISPTGSGKTLAYMLPAIPHILGQIDAGKGTPSTKGQGPICLVLNPTRELAKQVCDSLGGHTGWLQRLFGLKAGAVYGGIGKDVQLDSILSMGAPQIMSATPGRLLDLLSMDVISLLSVTYLVLDEADRMLALGFEPQLTAIMKGIRPNRQVSLFSATFALKLQETAEEWMSKERVVIRVATMQMDRAGEGQEETDVQPGSKAKPEGNTAEDDQDKDDEEAGRKTSENDVSNGLSTLTVSPTVTQTVHLCSEHKKQKKLLNFLIKVRRKDSDAGIRQRSAVLIFCKEIKTLRAVATFLWKSGERCAPLHGGIPQLQREQALADLKSGRIDSVVATDVASRGLHISRLKYVVNYDFPGNLAVYCHRIGRVGRQGAEGWAFSFFTRNLEAMAPGLVALLERCKQWVDPNIKALAEGSGAGKGLEDNAGEGEDSSEEGSVEEDSKSVAAAKPPSNGELVAAPQFSVGAAVSIHGMEKSPQLNGCKGHLTRWLKKGGRWEVALDSSAEVKSLRLCNLELVATPAPRADAAAGSVASGGDDSEADESDSPAAPSGGVGSSGGLRIKPSQGNRFAGMESSEDDEAQGADGETESKPARKPRGRSSAAKKRRRGTWAR